MMGKNTASSLFEKEDAYADVVDNCFVDIAVRTGMAVNSYNFSLNGNFC